MLDRAIALYDRNDFAAAAPLFAAAIPDAPERKDAWRYLALSLLRQGLQPQMLGLLELRQQQQGDAPSLLYDVLHELAAEGHDATIQALAQRIPGNTVLGVILEFFLGCLAARRDEPEEALARLNRAALGAAQCSALLEPDPRLCSISTQGHVLSDFAFVDRLASETRAEILAAVPSLAAAIDFDPAPIPATAAFIYLASCNQLYLERFGAMLADACDAAGITTVLHLHIVDPTDETPATLARLAQGRRHLTLRHSSEEFRSAKPGGYHSAGYYACARFLRAEEIAAHYHRDLLILDMDTGHLGDVARLAEVMQRAELGYFGCGDVLPWLLCRAAAVYIRRCAATVPFSDLLGKYIAAKIERQGYWGLDQAALYVISRYVAARHPPFRYLELSSELGIALDAFARSESTTDEKQRLRGRSTGPASPAATTRARA